MNEQGEAADPEAPKVNSEAAPVPASVADDAKQHKPQTLARNFRSSLCGLAVAVLAIGVLVILLATLIEYEEQESPVARLENLNKD